MEGGGVEVEEGEFLEGSGGREIGGRVVVDVEAAVGGVSAECALGFWLVYT